MLPGRTIRPSLGTRPRARPLVRRRRGTGPLPPRRAWAFALALAWVVAALLAPRTALALDAAVHGPGAATAVHGLGAATAVEPGPRPPAGQPSEVARAPLLWPPVVGPLVRGYEAPAGPYGAGHRGLDIAATPGVAVRAPAAGRVVFAGSVAGTVWVSIEVATGVVVTLGPLRALVVSGAQRVARGARVADLAPGHGTVEHPTTLHLGLRVDGVYVDPLPWLVGLGPPRLAPLREPGGPH